MPEHFNTLGRKLSDAVTGHRKPNFIQFDLLTYTVKQNSRNTGMKSKKQIVQDSENHERLIGTNRKSCNAQK